MGGTIAKKVCVLSPYPHHPHRPPKETRPAVRKVLLSQEGCWGGLTPPSWNVLESSHPFPLICPALAGPAYLSCQSWGGRGGGRDAAQTAKQG